MPRTSETGHPQRGSAMADRQRGRHSAAAIEAAASRVPQGESLRPTATAARSSPGAASPGRGPQVGILMGSDSDWPVMQQAAQVLDSFNVAWEAHPFSAHRSPDLLRDYVAVAPSRGIRVFICGAGGAAHLAGVVASHTTLPVIGVPIESKALKGLDSLLATAQMPTGVPVATVAIDGAANAAILAVQCLALADPKLAEALAAHKRKLVDGVRASDQNLAR